MIASAIRSIAGNPVLSPDGRVSLFSPSFSAAMCIIAASRPDTAGTIGAICSVGTFGSVETAIEFLFARQDSDEYGRMIVLRNSCASPSARIPRWKRPSIFASGTTDSTASGPSCRPTWKAFHSGSGTSSSASGPTPRSGSITGNAY